NSQGLWIRALARRLVLDWNADHARISAQIDLRSLRIEHLGDGLFQLAAGDQFLDVDLAVDGVGLARCERDVRVVAMLSHQSLVNIQVSQVAAIANTAG